MEIKKLFKRLGSRLVGIFKVKGFRKNKGLKKKLLGDSKKSRKKLPEPTPLLELLNEAQISPEIPPILEPVANSFPRAFTAISEFSEVQLSANTQRAYKRDLEDFFSFLRGNGLFENWGTSVSPIHVAQFRQYLLQSRKLSRPSVTRKLAVLKSFYRWARARGWVDQNPAELVKSFPQTQESKTGFLSEPEIYRLLQSFGEISHLGLFRALSKVSVETLLMLGLRRAEAAKIRVMDLEYSDGRWLVRIRGKGERDRLLPLPEKLLKTWSEWWRRVGEEVPQSNLEKDPPAWMDWIKRHGEFPLIFSSRSKVIGTPLSGSELARIVRKASRRAGIVQRVHPHMLRATAITHALDQGATHRGVQQMAGWTSPLMITRYDKRRKDPRHSAIHQLRYAQINSAPAAVSANRSGGAPPETLPDSGSSSDEIKVPSKQWHEPSPNVNLAKHDQAPDAAP